MHIIFGSDALKELTNKYIILPLDTFSITESADPVTAYALVENIPIDQLGSADQFRDLHEKLMENYAKKNWKFCQDAIEHLYGKWNSELDTFYEDLSRRIVKLKDTDPGDDWSPVLDKKMIV